MSWRSQLSKRVNELRVLYCQKGASSAGARSFVQKNYTDLKALNPTLPILIRECGGIEPQVIARYGLGKEQSINVTGMSEDQVTKAVEELFNKAPQ